MAKTYYNKLLRESVKNPVTYTINNVPAKYQAQVIAYADADLASGKLPQWQYNKMMGIEEEGV